MAGTIFGASLCMPEMHFRAGGTTGDARMCHTSTDAACQCSSGPLFGGHAAC